MNSPRLTNPRRLAFFGGLLLLISLALLFSARDLIRELVVLPLSYLVWAGRVFVYTTPQIFFWGLLLVFGGLAAYRSLTGPRRVYLEEPLDQAENGYNNILQGQVAFWALRMHLLRQAQSGYFLNSFHQGLGRILFDALGHRHRMTFQQVEAHLREDTLPVPPEVRQYALASLRRLDGEQPPLLARATRRARFWLQGLAAMLRGKSAAHRSAQRPDPARALSQDEQWVIQVIQYLEEELEVSNDDSGR